jgi:hypothetical protein
LPPPHSFPPSSRRLLNCPCYIMSQSLSPSLSHIHVLTRLIYLVTLLSLLPLNPEGVFLGHDLMYIYYTQIPMDH